MAEGWRGAAATIFGWAAEGHRAQVLEAAGSFRMTARALAQLAAAVEDAQQRAERALVSMQVAEEDVGRARQAAGRAGSPARSGGSHASLAAAEEQYLWIRKRAEAECLAAVEAVQTADGTAAVIIEAQAFHAPKPPLRSLPDDAETLDDEEADPAARAAALARLVADRRYDVERAVSKLLDDDSPLLRGQALFELIRTWRLPLFGRAREMLEDDPDWECRAAAAEAMAYVITRFPDSRDDLVELLVDILLKENDPRVEEAIRRTIALVKQPPASAG